MTKGLHERIAECGDRNPITGQDDISKYCGFGAHDHLDLKEAAEGLLNAAALTKVLTLSEIRAEAVKFYTDRFDSHEALIPQTLRLMIRMVDAMHHATQENIGAWKMDLLRLDRANQAAGVIRQLEKEIKNLDEFLAETAKEKEILNTYRSVLSEKLAAAQIALKSL